VVWWWWCGVCETSKTNAGGLASEESQKSLERGQQASQPRARHARQQPGTKNTHLNYSSPPPTNAAAQARQRPASSTPALTPQRFWYGHHLRPGLSRPQTLLSSSSKQQEQPAPAVMPLCHSQGTTNHWQHPPSTARHYRWSWCREPHPCIRTAPLFYASRVGSGRLWGANQMTSRKPPTRKSTNTHTHALFSSLNRHRNLRPPVPLVDCFSPGALACASDRPPAVINPCPPRMSKSPTHLSSPLRKMTVEDKGMCTCSVYEWLCFVEKWACWAGSPCFDLLPSPFSALAPTPTSSPLQKTCR